MQIHRMLDLLEGELMSTIELPGEDLLAELEDLNRDMAELAEAWDWSPLLALNRTFHFKIFQLSPASLILHEVERLWGLADPFIASKLSLLEARRRIIAENDQLLQAMQRGDRPGAIAALEQHRASTRAALMPAPAAADKPSTRGSKRRPTA